MNDYNELEIDLHSLDAAHFRVTLRFTTRLPNPLRSSALVRVPLLPLATRKSQSTHKGALK
jgi:hypothetical protein